MFALITYVIIIGILLGIYWLAKLGIEKYFESKKGRFDADKSNYPTVFAIGAILTAFLVMNPRWILGIINLTTNFINQKFNISIRLLDYEPGLVDVILYFTLVSGICISLFFSYRHRAKEYEKYVERIKSDNQKESRIIFPENHYLQSPYLHERIAELFELKFKRYDIKMQETRNAAINKVLYGSFSDSFRTYYEIVFCDDNSTGSISADKCKETYLYLRDEVLTALRKDGQDFVANYYYISAEAGFESDQADKIACYTEQQFVNGIIDFKRYLRRSVEKFNSEKLFSAIKKENERKTLAETFIQPNYYILETERRHSGLAEYLDAWLTDSSDSKHMVILGGYGMGKTSFMKFYAARLAKRTLEHPTDNQRIPIFLSLTNCSPVHGGIERMVQAFVAENLGIDYELFRRLIERGKFLFLLDAFDEMGYIGTNQQRFKQFNEIWQLAVKNNKIILSGRPSYFPNEFEMRKSLAITTLEDEVIQTKPYAEKIILDELDEAKIGDYIGKYYPGQEGAYLDWLKKDSNLFDLCKRPSMTHLIREMLPVLYVKLSNDNMTAGKIMKQYVEYWINRQESKNITSAFEKNEKTKHEYILSFFEDLSLDIYLSSNAKIPYTSLPDKINIKNDSFGLQWGNNYENKEGFEQEIISGYFIEREQDEYQFVHKSFYEYFVAQKIISLIKDKEFSHEVMFKPWTTEINDFVYDAIDEKNKNHTHLPALLLQANRPSMSKLKLLLYWASANNSFSIAIAYLIFALYYAFLYNPLFKKEKFDLIDKVINFSLKSHVDFVILLFLLILTTLLILIFSSLFEVLFAKTNSFTQKCLILSVSKNEKSSLKNTKLLLSRGTQLSHGVFSNMKAFRLGTYENKYKYINFCKFTNINFSGTYFRSLILTGCDLKNITFYNLKIADIKFDNCLFINADFENLIFYRNWVYYQNMITGFLNFSNWHIKTFRKIKAKSRKANCIRFVNISRSQIDSYSLQSLARFIRKNKIQVGLDIQADEWLLNELNQLMHE